MNNTETSTTTPTETETKPDSGFRFGNFDLVDDIFRDGGKEK